MTFCAQCGQPTEANAHFCRSCGSPVAGSASAAPAATPATPSAQAPMPPAAAPGVQPSGYAAAAPAPATYAQPAAPQQFSQPQYPPQASAAPPGYAAGTMPAARPAINGWGLVGKSFLVYLAIFVIGYYGHQTAIGSLLSELIGGIVAGVYIFWRLSAAKKAKIPVKSATAAKVWAVLYLLGAISVLSRLGATTKGLGH